MKRLFNVLAITSALALATSASAQVWNEVGDAGDLPGTAQDVIGVGPLTRIIGTTSGADPNDLYRFVITDPIGFQASTAAAAGGFGSYDTELFLLRNDGRGLLMNDDSFATLQSTIAPPATDGTAQTVPGVGVYIVGISSFNRNPTATGGRIFNQVTFTEISGPDGPGGANPHTGYENAGGGGQYEIALRGAAFIPEPATLGLLALGGLALLRRR